MGFTTTTTTTTTPKSKSSSEGWGMGFLFVFLPEDDTKRVNHPFTSSPSSSSSSSPSFKQPITAFLKRTNSSHLLSTAQSTISICALLLFITLLLFTLSTFEPSASVSTHHFPLRRQLYGTKPTSSVLYSKSLHYKHALQGMGTLYRRGTRAMNELVVAHVTENLSSNELKIFLRLLHRSGITSRSDLLIISSSKAKSVSMDNTIAEENDSFLKLIDSYSANSTQFDQKGSFDITQFTKLSKKEKEMGESIWGKKIRSNSSMENGTESTRLSYGSVVGFDVDELDPENSLAGFLDHVPMTLRRWACYPMLLGRVRRNFKHLTLVDAKEILLLSDPLVRVRNKSPESVHLALTQHLSSGKHAKRNSEKTQQKLMNPAIIVGGARGVRRLSNAMVTEIARAAMQHKKKNMVTELGIFNQLVGNENLLKNVNLITGTELVPELSSLTELSNSKSNSSLSIFNLAMARRGNSNSGLHSAIVKHICSFSLDSKAYTDC